MNKKSPSIDNNNNDSRFLINKYCLQINDKCKISYDLLLLAKYLDMLRDTYHCHFIFCLAV